MNINGYYGKVKNSYKLKVFLPQRRGGAEEYTLRLRVSAVKCIRKNIFPPYRLSPSTQKNRSLQSGFSI